MGRNLEALIAAVTRRTTGNSATRQATASARGSALLSQADDLRDAGDWLAASAAYATFLTETPDHVAGWVQYGHALKEAGRLDEAATAYAKANALAPQDPDPSLHLGHALKLLGRLDDAIAAYRVAFRLAPHLPDARLELIALGVRNVADAYTATPSELYALAGELRGVRTALEQLEKRLPALETFTAIPPSHYNDFRAAFDVVGDPGEGAGQGGPFTIVINADQDDPAALAATLHSLVGQTRADWTATVLAHPALLADRAATWADRDPRIVMEACQRGSASADPGDAGAVMFIRAGTVFDRRALTWFAAVLERTGALGAICDHDHVAASPSGMPHYSEPRLLGPLEPDAILQSDDVLAAPVFTAAGWRAAAPYACSVDGWEDGLRMALLHFIGDRPFAHIPRVLASRPARPMPQEAATASKAVLAAAGAQLLRAGDRLVTQWSTPGPDEMITVIIPTRDRAELLRPCLDTLLATMTRPSAVEIVVVDNASREPQTLSMLADYVAGGRVRVQRVEETFNWSRLNNLAAAQASAGLLLFINNDTEMLTAGWDVLLRGYARRDDVGAVGARLVYPNMRLQHAGIALGVGDMPRHEGLGRPLEELGPGARWAATRPAAAVTGAFLAAPRDLFLGLGGFDEAQMPIAYSDVDFCLKVRQAGRKVLYAPALTLIHAESQSRGLNHAEREHDWDLAEYHALRRRWGDALDRDPTLNPYWRPVMRPTDTLRAPPLALAWEWIAASVSANPWGVHPARP